MTGMQMKKTGFYIIKDKFFEDMPAPYFKGNLVCGKHSEILKQMENFIMVAEHLTMVIGEHWFHTDEQLAFLDVWMKEVI